MKLNLWGKKWWITFILMIFVCLFTVAQQQTVKIQGRIINKDNAPLSQVNITLYSAKTSKQIAGTSSTEDGSFILKDINFGKYNILISCIGYSKKIIPVSVDATPFLLGDIDLQQISFALDSVVITAQTIETFADKRIYRFTPTDKQSSNTALDLLQVIPKLSVFSRQLTTIDGQQVKILLNGVNADETDLLTLRPNDIARVEFFENSPARFASMGLGAVVNIITKKMNTGGAVAMNLQNAFTTAFGNDIFNIIYNTASSQFGIKYNLSYRNQKHRKLDEYLQYQVGEVLYHKEKKGIDSPDRYKDQTVELSFNHQKENNYVLNLNLYFQDFNLRSGIHQKINQFAPVQMSKQSQGTDKDKYRKPVADIYFNKKITEKHELLFNIVGTYFDTQKKYNYKEFLSGTDYFSTVTSINGKKYSLIGEAIYSWQIGQSQILNIGGKYTIASNKQDMTVTQFENLKSTNNEICTYAEWSGRIKKFTYAIAAGFTHLKYDSKSLSKNYNYTYFRPSLTLRYMFSPQSDIGITYMMNSISPSLAQLTNNIYFKDEGYAFAGNPSLHPYNQHQIIAMYMLNNKYFTLAANVNFQYGKDFILPYFLKQERYLLETYGNMHRSYILKGGLLLQYFPFPSKVVRLRCYTEINTARNKMEGVHWSLTDWRIVPSVVFFYKKWDVQIFYQSKTKKLSGQLLSIAPSMAMAELSYSPIKNLTATLGLRYPFYSAYESSNETHQVALIQKIEKQKISDYANMVYVGFIYNFGFGKQRKTSKAVLQNQDTDSGILKKD